VAALAMLTIIRMIAATVKAKAARCVIFVEVAGLVVFLKVKFQFYDGSFARTRSVGLKGVMHPTVATICRIDVFSVDK